MRMELSSDGAVLYHIRLEVYPRYDTAVPRNRQKLWSRDGQRDIDRRLLHIHLPKVYFILFYYPFENK